MRKGVAVAAGGLRTRVADGAAWLTLERPETGNRITPALAAALCQATGEIELNDAVHVVVLAAAGRSFCLGIEEPGTWEHHNDWVAAVARLTRPVIAVVQGDAIAEGCELVLACDLSVVSERARFALPQLASGRLPSHGGTQRLPRAIGRMRALEMLFTGRLVGAPEAEAIGLTSRVIAHAALTSAARKLVGELMTKGPIALRYAKEAVLRGSDLTLDQGIRMEEDLYVMLQTTHDRCEGITAFLEKRAPVFQAK